MVSHTMLHVFLIGPLPTRIEALRKEVADLEGRRSTFFLALVDPVALEINLSFLGFIDEVVSPLFSSLIPYLVHFMFPIALIWQI